MIFIALGANLPGPGGSPPRATLEAALDLLDRQGVAVRRVSRWYCSAPVPAGDQPVFVNAVAEVDSALDPAALLALLHRVEETQGRVRTVANGPRTCDLDLLDYHGRIETGATGGPILPHPRLAERLFVLLPLADLAPGWVHPATGRGIAEMISAVPPGQRCEPMAAAAGTFRAGS